MYGDNAGTTSTADRSLVRRANPQPGTPPPAGGLPGMPPDTTGTASVPGGVQTRTAGTPPAGGLPGMQPFDATNNLIGQQINPTQSNATRHASGLAGQAASNVGQFDYGKFNGVQPLDFSKTQQGLDASGAQMAGLQYNYDPANSAYKQGQSVLGNAGNTATNAFGALAGGSSLGQSIGGGANLANTAGLNSGLNTAASTVGGPFAYQGDVGTARGLTLGQLQSSLSSPDRQALALSNYDLLQQRSEPAYQASLRDVSGQSAAMGRRGSGLTTNNLGTVASEREKYLSQNRQQLSNDAAGQTLSDNINKTNLGLGVASGFGALDTNAANVQLGQAGMLKNIASDRFEGDRFNASQGEAASQRAMSGANNYNNFQRNLVNDQYGVGQDQANYSERLGGMYQNQATNNTNLGVSQAGFTRNLANDRGAYTKDAYTAGVNERDAARKDQYNQGTENRSNLTSLSNWQQQNNNQDIARQNRYTNERDYQYGLSQDATSQERQRMMDEETLRNGQYNRGYQTAGLGFNAQSPYNAYQNAANNAQGNANELSSGIGQFVQNYAANRNSQRRSGAGVGAPVQGGVQYGGESNRGYA